MYTSPPHPLLSCDMWIDRVPIWLEDVGWGTRLHVDTSPVFHHEPFEQWTMRLTLWANSKYLPVRTLRSSTKILEIVDMEAICVAPAGDWEMSKLFQYSNSKQRNVEDPYNFVIWDFPTEDIRGGLNKGQAKPNLRASYILPTRSYHFILWFGFKTLTLSFVSRAVICMFARFRV